MTSSSAAGCGQPQAAMRHTVRPARLRRMRRAQGAMLLFILLVGLPVLFISGAISVDYARAMGASRQAGQLADAASLAGALAVKVEPGEPPIRIDQAEATREVEEYIKTAKASGAAGKIVVEDWTVTVNQGQYDSDLRAYRTAPSVTVTVRYKVDNLLFVGLVSGRGSDTIQRGTVSRTSTLCLPGADNPITYGGNCVRAR